MTTLLASARPDESTQLDPGWNIVALVEEFLRAQTDGGGITSAQLDPGFQLDPTVQIDPGSQLDPTTQIGIGDQLDPTIQLDPGAQLDPGTQIYPGTQIDPYSIDTRAQVEPA